jgi:actin-related protein
MINIVLDIGTQNTKVGFGGESLPRFSTASLLFEQDGHRGMHEI